MLLLGRLHLLRVRAAFLWADHLAVVARISGHVCASLDESFPLHLLLLALLHLLLLALQVNGNHEGCERVATDDTAIVHNVLRGDFAES